MIVRMSRRFAVVWCQCLALLGALLASSCGAPAYREAWVPPPPPRQPVRPVERVEPVGAGPEQELFALARLENRRLCWDGCLARIAHQRARKMAEDGRFDHKDPKTGKNQAWKLIESCDRYRCAGENLIRGNETPKAMHRALMDSRKHRENILSPDFDVLGIGCYREICVQLFAGY